MARYNDPENDNLIHERVAIQLLLIIPVLLIKIGEGVRIVLRMILRLISSTYNVLALLSTETVHGITSWIKEKFAPPIPKRPVGRPKRKITLFDRARARWIDGKKLVVKNTGTLTSRFADITHSVISSLQSWEQVQEERREKEEARIKKKKLKEELIARAEKPLITFPKIVLPTIRFPTISFPTIVLPTLRSPKFPRFRVTKISGRKPTVIYPPPATPSRIQILKSFVA